MIQQPRVLRPGNHPHGLDVLACKLAIHRWERVRGHEQIIHSLPTAKYGAGAVKGVNQFKHHHALPQDGVLGPRSYALLYPWLNSYDRSLLRLYVRRHPSETGRGRVLDQLHWLMSNHDGVHWAMWRPVPLARFRDHVLPIYSDCSGSIIGAFFAAGAPDPGGNEYNGQGSTASFLANLEHINRSELSIADIIVFGYYPGEHAVAYLGGGMIYTHGHEGTPDDPREMALSSMESYFQSVGIYGETFLRVPLA